MSEPRFAYPMMVNLEGCCALVVGGGKVALRKAQALAEAGARVRCVSPEFVAGLAADERVECIRGRYERAHLEGVRVVVAATDDEPTNARVASDARAAGAWVNVVDRPGLCDFIVPAQVRRGSLTIAIATDGSAPALARRVRERLEAEFGPEYETYLSAMREARGLVQSRGLSAESRRRVFERLAGDDVVAAAREGPEAVRRLIDETIRSEAGGGAARRG